jgi:hypothetical protein
MFKYNLFIILAVAALVQSGSAQDRPGLVEVCTDCRVMTVGEVVETRMTPEMRTQTVAEMEKEGVPYADVKDVQLVYDKKNASLGVVGNEKRHPLRYMIYVGAHLGALFPFGVDAIASLSSDERPLWDLDASWEPSGYQQSYSLGAAYHPFRNALFIGARIREMQMHAPWSRGYDSRVDNEWGGGLEAGVRGRLWGSRFLGSFSLGAFYVTNEVSSLPVMFTLNVGLAYGVAGN